MKLLVRKPDDYSPSKLCDGRTHYGLANDGKTIIQASKCNCPLEIVEVQFSELDPITQQGLTEQGYRPH